MSDESKGWATLDDALAWAEDVKEIAEHNARERRRVLNTWWDRFDAAGSLPDDPSFEKVEVMVYEFAERFADQLDDRRAGGKASRVWSHAEIEALAYRHRDHFQHGFREVARRVVAEMEDDPRERKPHSVDTVRRYIRDSDRLSELKADIESAVATASP